MATEAMPTTNGIAHTEQTPEGIKTLHAVQLWIALPMIALLLFVNLTMGVISRIAPQMNIFAVGFPVTLTVGLVGIAATLPMLEQPLLNLLQQAIDIFQK